MTTSINDLRPMSLFLRVSVITWRDASRLFRGRRDNAVANSVRNVRRHAITEYTDESHP